MGKKSVLMTHDAQKHQCPSEFNVASPPAQRSANRVLFMKVWRAMTIRKPRKKPKIRDGEIEGVHYFRSTSALKAAERKDRMEGRPE